MSSLPPEEVSGRRPGPPRRRGGAGGAPAGPAQDRLRRSGVAGTVTVSDSP